MAVRTIDKNQMVLKIIFDWTHTGKVADIKNLMQT